MIAEFLLSGVLTACGCGVGYICHEVLRSKQERERNRQRNSFRNLLVGELRERPLDELRFGPLVSSSGIARVDADAVAEDLYLGLYRRVAADGIVAPRERLSLDRMARALEIDAGHAKQIEARAKPNAIGKASGNLMNRRVVPDKRGPEVSGR
jgi:hypothetical protein